MLIISVILLDVGYRGSGDVKVVLYGRGEVFEDGSFRPYIYIVPRDGKLPEGAEEVERIDLNRKVKVWKVFFRHPKEVPRKREELKELGELREADIPFVRRYMIDKGLLPLHEVVLPEVKPGKKEAHELRVLAFDIETLTDEGTGVGDSKIIMISLFGEGFEKVITWGQEAAKGVTVVENEAEMIREFVAAVEAYGPEVIVGYNSDGFDWPYLRRRAEKLKVPLKINGSPLQFVRKGRDNAVRIEGLVNIDLYIFIRNMLSQYMQSESLTLNAVAEEFLGKEKVQIGGAMGIEEAWHGDIEKLYRYSLQDSKLTYLLALEILPILYGLAKIVGQTIFDAARMSSGQMVEWLLIRKAFGEKMLVPNRPKYEEAAERRAVRFEGAFVKEPIKGLHKPIAVCDFRSLYPTIIIAHNISPDTINCGHRGCRKNRAPTGVWFCTDKEGFIPKTIRSIFEERMALKARMKELKKGTVEWKVAYTRQTALKLLLNSFYGYMGYSNARWYDIEAARATAAWGRDYITRIMRDAAMHGFTVVYGDTDSVMLTSDSSEFERDVRKFLKEINAKLPDPMRLELEGIFRSGVFVTKKRYALMRKDGSLVVKGLERVRRDWSGLARKSQEEVIRLVLQGKVGEAKEFIKGLVKKLRAKEVPIEELVIRTQLKKRIESYEQQAPHVKVARKLRAMGKKVTPGTVIEYVVAPGSRSISDRAVPASVAKDYDADYYIENQLLPAVSRIFEALGGDIEELRMKQAGLSQFLE